MKYNFLFLLKVLSVVSALLLLVWLTVYGAYIVLLAIQFSTEFLPNVGIYIAGIGAISFTLAVSALIRYVLTKDKDPF